MSTINDDCYVHADTIAKIKFPDAYVGHLVDISGFDQEFTVTLRLKKKPNKPAWGANAPPLIIPGFHRIGGSSGCDDRGWFYRYVFLSDFYRSPIPAPNNDTPTKVMTDAEGALLVAAERMANAGMSFNEISFILMRMRAVRKAGAA